MPVPTVQEFNDGKTDLDAVEDCVNTSASTYESRLSGSKLSLTGAISKIVHGVISAYSAGTTYTDVDVWVEQAGIVYRPLTSALPIGPEAFNAASWIVVQGFKVGDRMHPALSAYDDIRNMTTTGVADQTPLHVTDAGIAGAFTYNATGATANDITGITLANPCVVTYSGADNWANGDRVHNQKIVGTTELNGNRYTVANVDTGAKTFELSGVDSTLFTAYVSGGVVSNDDGGTIIVIDANTYAERPVNGPIQAAWFGVQGDYDIDALTGTDDTLALASAIAYASTSLATGLFVDKLVNAEVELPGMCGVTEVDIPSGVSIVGSRSSKGFVDIGTSTSRACIQVGDPTIATFSALCGIERCRIQGNATVGRTTVKYFGCIRECFFNQNYLYSGWRLLDTRSSWALGFRENYIVDGVDACVYLDNGTANNWYNNRVEVSEGPVVVIDGQGSFEPANVVFNGGAIQAGSEEGIKGIDVLSLELKGVFLESHNQAGGFAVIDLSQGTQSRIADYFKMSGGFCSQGSGMGGTFLNADCKGIYMNTEIRGSGFPVLVNATANTRHIELTGTFPSAGASTPITGYTEGFCEIVFAAGDRAGYTSNFTQGRTRNNARTITASATAGEDDNIVLVSTSAGAVVYTLRDADFTAGRTITLRNYTNDFNTMSVSIAGTTGKSTVGPSLSSALTYSRIDLFFADTAVFVYVD